MLAKTLLYFLLFLLPKYLETKSLKGERPLGRVSQLSYPNQEFLYFVPVYNCSVYTFMLL